VEYVLLMLGPLLAHNVMLESGLGLCPVFGATERRCGVMRVTLASAFMLLVAAAAAHVIEALILVPLELDHLRLVAFLLVIGATAPLVCNRLSVPRALVTTNSAVLGVALLALDAAPTLLETLLYAIGAAFGLALVTALIAEHAERLAAAPVPAPFRGAPIVLVTLGITALAFMGFTGVG